MFHGAKSQKNFREKYAFMFKHKNLRLKVAPFRHTTQRYTLPTSVYRYVIEESNRSTVFLATCHNGQWAEETEKKTISTQRTRCTTLNNILNNHTQNSQLF